MNTSLNTLVSSLFTQTLVGSSTQQQGGRGGEQTNWWCQGVYPHRGAGRMRPPLLLCTGCVGLPRRLHVRLPRLRPWGRPQPSPALGRIYLKKWRLSIYCCNQHAQGSRHMQMADLELNGALRKKLSCGLLFASDRRRNATRLAPRARRLLRRGRGRLQGQIPSSPGPEEANPSAARQDPVPRDAKGASWLPQVGTLRGDLGAGRSHLDLETECSQSGPEAAVLEPRKEFPGHLRSSAIPPQRLSVA